MGEVWVADDHHIGRDVAIKVMHADRDEHAVARFLREARVQGRLEHPAIVPVHDLVADPGTAPFFTMKRIAGTTLRQVIAQRTPGWSRRLLLARFVEVCLAMEFAHQRGVVHRDLKPENIMLGEFGETYVVDWGLAKISEAAGRESLAALASDVDDLRSDRSEVGRTHAGATLGTPGYMSPEQALGSAVDHRADVYALGCILFEILTGTFAFDPASALEAPLAVPCHSPSRRFPELDIPPELDAACASATRASRDERTASARQLADSVQRFLDGDRDLQRRRELARDHYQRAAAARTRGTELDRAEAIREAARAIALDPELAVSQDLMMRLLLEVPDRLPDGALRRVGADRCEATRTVLRIGVRAYLANLAVFPICKLVGVGGTWPFVTLTIVVLAQVALCAFAARRAEPITPVIWGLLLTNHVVMLSMVGIFFGSLIFVPIFALGMMPIMLTMPQVHQPRLALVVHVLALAVPLSLELAGLVPSTFTITADAIVFKPWAVHASPTVTVVAIFVVVVMQLWINMRVLSGGRASQERAHELLHAQRWQLEQLVS